MALADELIQAVCRGAGLSPAQATNAVGSMLRFFAAQLPSPLFGELQARLNEPRPAGASTPADRPSDTAGHDD